LIETLPTEGLNDENYKKIMVEMQSLGTEYFKHRFELSNLATNSLFYSIIDYMLIPLKGNKKLKRPAQFLLRRIRNYLIHHKKILVSYLNHVWTADLILTNVEPAPVRFVEYPWAIMNANLTKKMRILDIGSGRSLFPIYLASKGHEVVCIDNDEILMTKISPKLAEWSKAFVNYKTNDATKLEFKDNEFDIVFCLSVLEHLEEERVDGKRVNYHKQNLDVKAIGEMIRVVKPNGFVILTVEWSENPDDVQSYSFQDIFDRLLKPYHKFLENDKKPNFNWDDLKRKHFEETKRFRPDYPSSEGWAIGIVLQKLND